MAEITGLTAEDLAELLPHMGKEDATVFENILKRNPDFGKRLKERGLRQSDYDRRMNESKTEVEKAKQRAQELEAWYADNEPIHKRALEHAQELEVQAAELQKQLEEARKQRLAEGGDQVDAAELERRVRETVTSLGYVSKSEMESIIKGHESQLALEEAKKAISEANQEFYQKTLPQSVNFAADVAEICVDHKSEFGASLDRKEFAEFMRDRNMLDPKKAYEEFVTPKRQKVEMQKQIDEAVKKREEEIRQQYSGQSLGGGSPVNGYAPKGALQMKIERENAEKSTVGSGVAAAQAAAELRNEGKF